MLIRLIWICHSGGNSQQTSSSSMSCGEVKMAVPLVTAGQATLRGQWPWHVALYMIEGINLSYHCGGSLVSKNKIITGKSECYIVMMCYLFLWRT